MAAELTLTRDIQRTLGSWHWRLDHLYRITDKNGRDIPFRMNWAQKQLFAQMHYLNIVLKARQLGFSTFILMFMLDAALFNSNTRCGIIDVTLDDAKLKLQKIRYAYDRLPEFIRATIPIRYSNAHEIQFANGSAIVVGTSHRGGTLQYLHISEFGKICAKFPERAREIVTGALNTVQAGNFVFIESTAEGQEGRYYEMCMEAQSLQRMKRELTPLDFKFFFFPWWKAPEYVLDPEGVEIPPTLQTYFDKLRRDNGIALTRAQKAWYAKKAGTQLGDMKREYPSTPEEAFEASVEGAILGQWIEQAEEMGLVGDYPAYPDLPVHTAWDIGRRDYTSIWFFQLPIAKPPRIVRFYQNCMEGMPHYAQVCARIYAENGWKQGIDVVPHDGRVVEWGSNRSRLEQLIAAGFNPKIGTELSLHDGINAMRATIPACEWHAEGCREGFKALKQYRWEWDELRGAWKTGTPRHDANSHGADAFRTFAVSWRDIVPSVPKPVSRPTKPGIYMDEQGRWRDTHTLAEIIQDKIRKDRR